MAELDFCDGSDGDFDGRDGDGSASKDLDLPCHRFMADGPAGRNRHHGIFLSSTFLDLVYFWICYSFGSERETGD